MNKVDRLTKFSRGEMIAVHASVIDLAADGVDDLPGPCFRRFGYVIAYCLVPKAVRVQNGS